MTNLASAGFGTTQSLAPLHAKWGWIVALGVVYLIAGIIALGSVFAATVASVYVVGIMMMIAGRRRGHQRLPVEDLGPILSGSFSASSTSSPASSPGTIRC